MKSSTAKLRMRIRVYAGKRMIGPGKMELLQCIARLGSLSAAARAMGMSYMRAWTLVKEMNLDSDRPMVQLLRGGPSGGGARLTSFGKEVLAVYQEMERKSRKAAAPLAQRLIGLLRND